MSLRVTRRTTIRRHAIERAYVEDGGEGNVAPKVAEAIGSVVQGQRM